jgi:hypothetical protein
MATSSPLRLLDHSFVSGLFALLPAHDDAASCRLLVAPHARPRHSRQRPAAPAALYSMAFVLSFPMLWLSHVAHVSLAYEVTSVTGLVLALTGVVVTLWRASPYSGWVR